MPVAPGDDITIAKMQALADLANTKLLPVINAAIGADEFLAHSYTQRDVVTPALDGGGVSAQPNYEFPETISVPAPLVVGAANGAGHYGVNTAVSVKVWAYKVVAGRRQFANQPGCGSFTPSDDGVSIQWSWSPVTDVAGYVLELPFNFFANGVPFIDVGNVITFLDSGVNISLFNPRSWLHQLNRVRADWWTAVWTQITGAEGLFLSPDAPLSGPWCVAVNDPDRLPMLTGQGTLIACQEDPEFTTRAMFKQVEFWCAAADAAGLTVSVAIDTPNAAPTTNGMNATQTGAHAGNFNFKLRSGFAGTLILYLTIPLQSAVSPIGPVVVAGATVLTQTPNGAIFGTGYTLELKLQIDLVVGDNAVSVDTNGYFISGNSPSFHHDTLTITDGQVNIDNAPAVHPGDTVTRILSPQYAGAWLIFIGSLALGVPFGYYFSTVRYILSDVNVKGVWVAKTLPVPGINTFLDQDIPPYIGVVINGRVGATNIAVAGNGQIGINRPTVSSNKESAPVVLDPVTGQLVARDARVNPLTIGICAQATRYPVRRDTDKRVIQWGGDFDPYKAISILTPATIGPDPLDPAFDFFVPTGTTKIDIHVCEPNTVIQKDFAITDGDPMGKPLLIKVYTDDSGVPYVTGINSVTILPPDITPQNWVWTMTVENPDAAPGEITPFDVVVQLNLNNQAWPEFFPACQEFFSYSYDGSPWITGSQDDARNEYKNLPGSGYCIFKISVTRSAVSDTELEVKIGQRVNGGFSTLQSITIPAGQAAKTDVPVFFPVLAGQELCYQCTEAVVVDAWVNWQPIFFYPQYGIRTNWPSYTPFNPLYVLSFVNLFNPRLSNYPLEMNRVPTRFQFNLSSDIYNDTESALNILD